MSAPRDGSNHPDDTPSIRRSARKLRAAALVSTLILLALTSRTPQGLYSDVGWQMYGLSQFNAGSVHRLLDRKAALPADIARDTTGWVSWWAPGPVVLAYPLVRAGARPGTAIRAIAVIALVIGALGWATWIARFSIPWGIALIMAIGMPWLRFASNNLFYFSAEVFTFATAPWMLLAALWLIAQCDNGPLRDRALFARATVIGLAIGSCYLLKYSLVLPALGVMAYVALATVPLPGSQRFRRWKWSAVDESVDRREDPPRATARRLDALAFACLGFGFPVITLNILNRSRGAAANLVAASSRVHFSWESLAWVVASPGLALADADSVWRYVLVHLHDGLVSSNDAFAVPGLVVAPVLAWLLTGFRGCTRATLIAYCATISSLVGVFMIWTASQAVSYESRHVAGASLALLPIAIAAGVDRWRGAAWKGRWLLGAFATVFVAVPLVYGPVSVIGKIARTPSNYRTGRAGIYNPLLSSRDAAYCVAWAATGVDTVSDVWLLTDPMTGLDIPGRALLVHADFLPIDLLRRTQYSASRPTRVNALLPPTFERDGKGPVLRASFLGAGQWTRTSDPNCEYARWSTVVMPRPVALHSFATDLAPTSPGGSPSALGSKLRGPLTARRDPSTLQPVTIRMDRRIGSLFER